MNKRISNALLVVACVAVLIAVTRIENSTSSSPATDPAPPPADPRHMSIMEAFHRYVAAGNMAAMSGDMEHPWLRDHAEPAAYVWLAGQVTTNEATGHRFSKGVKVLTTEVVELGGQAVRVDACVDFDEFVLLDQGTGQQVPQAQREPTRWRTTTQMHERDGDWVVVWSTVFLAPVGVPYTAAAGEPCQVDR